MEEEKKNNLICGQYPNASKLNANSNRQNFKNHTLKEKLRVSTTVLIAFQLHFEVENVIFNYKMFFSTQNDIFNYLPK
jgi:hypothetical protein